jgi:hypothetical protein
MSTPTWVRFSPFKGTVESAIARTALLRKQLRFRLREAARLAWARNRSKVEFVDDSLVKTNSEKEALKRAEDWDGLALSYEVTSIKALTYLYFWKADKNTGMALETDTQIPHFASDQLPEGKWFEEFLCRYTVDMGASLSAYGFYCPVEYKSLEAQPLLKELRDGSLLLRPLPSFLMIADELLSQAEMASILRSHKKHPSLHYRHIDKGYHLLSSITR